MATSRTTEEETRENDDKPIDDYTNKIFNLIFEIDECSTLLKELVTEYEDRKSTATEVKGRLQKLERERNDLAEDVTYAEKAVADLIVEYDQE